MCEPPFYTTQRVAVTLAVVSSIVYVTVPEPTVTALYGINTSSKKSKSFAPAVIAASVNVTEVSPLATVCVSSTPALVGFALTSLIAATRLFFAVVVNCVRSPIAVLAAVALVSAALAAVLAAVASLCAAAAAVAALPAVASALDALASAVAAVLAALAAAVAASVAVALAALAVETAPEAVVATPAIAVSILSISPL